jgi:quercetin dioxygenase-like cupin family protein
VSETSHSAPRRIVTGHDEQGRSIVLSDKAAKTWAVGDRGFLLYDLWRTTETPALLTADEPDPVEVPLDFNIDQRGVRMRMIDIPPSGDAAPPWKHRTNSLDYGYVIDGEVTLLLDESELTLRAGDIIVQRGTNHAWANRSARRCRMLVVMIGAEFAPDIANAATLYSAQELTETLANPTGKASGEQP